MESRWKLQAWLGLVSGLSRNYVTRSDCIATSASQAASRFGLFTGPGDFWMEKSEEKNLGGRPTVSQPVKKLPRPRVSFAAKEQYQDETGEQELGPFPAWLGEKLATLRRLEEQCVNKPGGELREHYLNGCLLS